MKKTTQYKDNLPCFEIDFETFPKTLKALLDGALANISGLLRLRLAMTGNGEHLLETIEATHQTIEQHFSILTHHHALHNTNAVRTCYEACLPLLTNFDTQILQDKRIYQAIQAITPQTPLTKKYIKDFQHYGVALPKTAQKRFKAIENRLAVLESQFENHLQDLEASQKIPIKNKKQLKGIPDAFIEKMMAQGLTLDFPTYHAVMSYAENRSLRKKMLEAYQSRASHLTPAFDNTPLMEEILALRYEKAQLLGFPHFAAYSLDTKMAKTPEVVFTFLNDLLERVHAHAKKDLASLSEYAKTHGYPPIKPWDLAFLSEKLKVERFQFTEESLREYFSFKTVWQEIQTILQRLYGLTFTEVTPPSRLDPKVRCYALSDNAQNLLGYLYVDLLVRPLKRGGAWMDSLSTHTQTSLPIASLNCNFMSDQLLHEEVLTLFHELGHCLHHLLSRVDTFSLSGIHGIEWDAVEWPSQLFEHWCMDKTILNTMMQPTPPATLIDKLQQSHTFLSGLSLIRQLEFSLFDLTLHMTPPSQKPGWIHQLLKKIRKKTALMPLSRKNYFENSFSHIFAGGYAAGYYSYLWAEVLACDSFSKFKKTGILNAETGQAFKKEVLEKGASRPAMAHFEAFMQRKPEIEAFLAYRGILIRTYEA